MNKFSRGALVALLSDRQFHSGEYLGKQLGLSRAAIWKQIRSLQNDGLLIESVHAKGYRLLSRIELLDKDSILLLLPDEQKQKIRLEIFEALESSNQYLMASAPGVDSNTIPVCLVEKQTAGRGRRGKRWQTPYATAIALSLRWKFETDASALAGLSLATGVAVLRTLAANNLYDVNLKWPNDLVCGNKKLAGILIEIVGDAAGPCEVVIGIGLNVTNSTANSAASMLDVDQAWTDVISQVSDKNAVSRNRIAASLISHLLEMLVSFEEQGFQPFRDEFEKKDALLGREVCVQYPGRKITGVACGVNESGGLLLQLDNEVVTITSGDVSVRAMKT
ncbi:MAG: bifunctional biotin--[acetyl-CoA-carboxylase] ligase/biotin operon repressor BirA [Gammaproteobacteria bacterium]|nr:bifunctional biotin--[acetyl-CoA-carboxylase] ligase/biotin operon repressor BirA [Gammaproteobacteria bacterium]